MKAFSIKQVLRQAWAKTAEHFWFLAGLVALPVVVQFVLQICLKQLFGDAVFASHLVVWLFNIAVGMGTVRIGLDIVDRDVADYEGFFTPLHLFLPVLGATILYYLGVLAGFILLIIPGVIASIVFCFYVFVIVDTGLGPVEALKRSAELSKGNRLRLLGFGIVSGLINIAGALVFVIGLFWTVPLTLLASVYVYRTLAGQTPASR